jgi:hypothetical protein
VVSEVFVDVWRNAAGSRDVRRSRHGYWGSRATRRWRRRGDVRSASSTTTSH